MSGNINLSKLPGFDLVIGQRTVRSTCEWFLITAKTSMTFFTVYDEVIVDAGVSR